MKHILLFVICLMTVTISLKAKNNIAADTSKIKLNISLNKTAFLKPDSIIATLVITNLTQSAATVGDLFRNYNEYCYLSVTDEIGRAISPLKVAFANYAEKPLSNVITIAAGRSVSRSINLGTLLKVKNEVLKGGVYQLEFRYINYKGNSGVKGIYYSNQVNFSLPVEVPKVVSTNPAVKTTTVVSNVATFTATKDTTLIIWPFKSPVKSKNQTGTFTDVRDGQKYGWVKIGKQIWMSQNLNYKTKNGHYHLVNNDTTNSSKLGLLYDFDAIQEACPEGWRIPTDAEWKELEKNALSANDRAENSKWEADDISNFLPGGSSGFDVLFPGVQRGTRLDQPGHQTDFWVTKDEDFPHYIYRRFFMKDMNKLMRGNQGIAWGISLRCIKNDEGDPRKQ